LLHRRGVAGGRRRFLKRFLLPLFDNLQKDLALFDHPELTAGPLLQGVQTLAEVRHFRLESLVAGTQLIELLFLRSYLVPHGLNLCQAAITDPQAIL